MKKITLITSSVLLLSAQAAAEGIQFGNIVPNFFGIGVGSTTQWGGSTDRFVGAVPGSHWKFDQNRYVEWYGPVVSVNLNAGDNWEYGPTMNLKLGRSDVDNARVAQLPEIGIGAEAGAFLAYSRATIDTPIPYYFRSGVSLTTAVLGDAEGTNFNWFFNNWIPLSPKLFIGAGVGVTWADQNYMQHNFGIDQQAAAQSSFAAYDADAGIRQWYAWPALIYRFSDDWALGMGAYYQRYTNAAAQTPFIKQEGDANQLTYGLGVGYTW